MMEKKKTNGVYKHGGATGKGWKPGQSGNPLGRPKRKTLTSIMGSLLDAPCPYDLSGRTWGEVVVAATLELAVKGHAVALKEVWERSDGKLRQSVSFEGRGIKEQLYDLSGLSIEELEQLREFVIKMSAAESAIGTIQ